MALDPGFVAYEGYRTASDSRSLVSGAPLPEWPDLSEEIRVAWRAAADAVLMMADTRPPAGTPVVITEASFFVKEGEPPLHGVVHDEQPQPGRLHFTVSEGQWEGTDLYAEKWHLRT